MHLPFEASDTPSLCQHRLGASTGPRPQSPYALASARAEAGVQVSLQGRSTSQQLALCCCFVAFELVQISWYVQNGFGSTLVFGR